jgi:hypothetical protein
LAHFPKKLRNHQISTPFSKILAHIYRKDYVCICDLLHGSYAAIPAAAATAVATAMATAIATATAGEAATAAAMAAAAGAATAAARAVNFLSAEKVLIFQYNLSVQFLQQLMEQELLLLQQWIVAAASKTAGTAKSAISITTITINHHIFLNNSFCFFSICNMIFKESQDAVAAITATAATITVRGAAAMATYIRGAGFRDPISPPSPLFPLTLQYMLKNWRTFFFIF